MIDIKYFQQNQDVIIARQSKRGSVSALADLCTLDDLRRDLMTKTQEYRAANKKLSKEFGKLKASGENTDELMETMNANSTQASKFEADLHRVTTEFEKLIESIPNTPDEDVPDGKSEDDNVVLKHWGEKPEFDFDPKNHWDLDIGISFEDGAKISGSRFSVMRGPAAKLERALINYMLDVHTREHNMEEVSVPYIVNRRALFGTGQFPKFKEDVYELETENKFLIPTAEVPVTNLVADQILPKDALPLRMVAHTPCFRSEAGSAGRDTRGMIRQHQFHKVEMVSVCHPDRSNHELERLLYCAERILQGLGLHYRVVTLCGGDLGFSAAKTYDIEVWLPGEGKYREISSISNCRDFQARRMKARFKNDDGKNELVHTLNGSGLAVGRTMVAIMENFQNENGMIVFPDVLRAYL